MATIREIADRLDLTPSTVSHALSGRAGKVSEATRARIAETARELGYAPNPAARALVSRGRTGNVGYVSRRYNNALYSALLEEVAIAVDERGGNLVTCVTGRDTEHRGQAQLLHTGTVDGIVAVPGALPDLSAPDSPWMRGPVVFLLTREGEARAASVGFDERGGVARVVAHLREGDRHRDLLYVQGVGVDGNVSGIGQARLELLEAAWADAGGGTVSAGAGFATRAGGAAAVAEAVAGGVPFSAVLAYNDQMAAGALQALRAAGRAVPGDVAVVGWNDLDDLPASLAPALTSVRVSPAALARAALDLLYRQIAAPPGERRALVPPVRHAVPVELVVRESSP